MNFYLSLFIFIISIITGLALMIAGRNMSREKFLLIASFHGIFLFAMAASLILKHDKQGETNNYFFTAFICSGLILSGLSWRSNAPKILRIYFSIFALTIPLFMFSPSMLLNFLVTMNYSGTNGPVFHLKDQYYLESQSTSNKPGSIQPYKIIIKKGMFHQTVKRDLVFTGVLDSARVIESSDDEMVVRGYSSTSTYVSSTIDSVDVSVELRSKKPGDVEYRL